MDEQNNGNEHAGVGELLDKVLQAGGDMDSQADRVKVTACQVPVRPLSRASRRMFVRLSAAAMSVWALPRLLRAQDGSSSASGLLQQGLMYCQGDGAVVNYSKAAALFQQALDAGSVDAQAWLGSLYLRGRGVARNDATAAGLISASAGAGSPVGLRFTGVLYEEGRTVSQDYTQASKFYEQAAAKGDAVAWGRLGMLYQRDHVKADRALAFTQFSEAAANSRQCTEGESVTITGNLSSQNGTFSLGTVN